MLWPIAMNNEVEIPADDGAGYCPQADHLRSGVFREMMTDLDKKQCRRLIVLRLIMAGFIKPRRIAQHFGISRRTLYYWIALLRYEGLDAALARKRRGGRLPRVYGGTLEAMREGVESKRWKSGVQVRDWLWEEHGVKLTLPGVYYWLRKIGWAARKSRLHD